MKLAEAAQFSARLAGGEVPRVLYGNDARLVNNIGRRRRLRRLRSVNPTRPADAASETVAQRLWERGVLLLEREVPVSIVDRVAAGVRDAVTTEGRWRDFSRGRPGVVRYVVDPAGTIAGFTELLTPAVLDVVRAYYGTGFALMHTRAWRIEHIDEDEARRDQYGNLWHTDQHDVTLIKVFVQLDDLSTDRGAALQTHDLATTRLAMRSGFVHQTRIYGPARRLINEPGRALVFDASPGSALFCVTPRCLHRAGNPAPGRPRHMSQFTFMPAPVEPVDHFANLGPDPSFAA